jgi:hypothetical protein
MKSNTLAAQSFPMADFIGAVALFYIGLLLTFHLLAP